MEKGLIQGPVLKSDTMWKKLPSGLTAAMYNPYTKRTNYFINHFVYQLNRYNEVSICIFKLVISNYQLISFIIICKCKIILAYFIIIKVEY